MYTNFYNNLDNIKGTLNIRKNELMSAHTTFRIGGPADIFIKPTVAQIGPVIDECNKNNIPYTVIGNGSNLLVSDEGIEGVVIAITPDMAGQIDVFDDIVIAEAGAMLSSVANAAATASLTGMEFASGIPGSVGGAVYMNAGAYGGEIKDILTSATVLLPDGSVEKWNADRLEMGYRHSILEDNGAICLSAEFKLNKSTETEVRETMARLRDMRVAKQPLNYPSAGSTFKRPQGYFAAALIEEAGLKGFSIGGAAVSDKHAGFVINTGGATCKDVLNLMSAVTAKVKEHSGVTLLPEVKYIGKKMGVNV